MSSIIQAISYYLPTRKLTNATLSQQHPEWPIEKIASKTGILERPFSAYEEYSLELAEKAANQFFDENAINRGVIDFIIFCSQTPKYLIATSSCILQHKLGLATTCGAIDLNLGCSGYVNSLAIANALIKSVQAKHILLITADTYTKLINADNRQLKTLFADAATASLITMGDNQKGMQTFVFGCDGSGAEKLISKTGGLQGLIENAHPYVPDLTMDGPEICTFVLQRVPELVGKLLQQAKLNISDIDLFIFHQANRYILESLRQKLSIAAEKFYIYLENVGNTVSSTIPIALKNAINEGLLPEAAKLMLVGFGVGYSWSGAILNY